MGGQQSMLGAHDARDRGSAGMKLLLAQSRVMRKIIMQ